MTFQTTWYLAILVAFSAPFFKYNNVKKRLKPDFFIFYYMVNIYICMSYQIISLYKAFIISQIVKIRNDSILEATKNNQNIFNFFKTGNCELSNINLFLNMYCSINVKTDRHCVYSSSRSKIKTLLKLVLIYQILSMFTNRFL